MIISYWHTNQAINEHLLNEEMNEYVFVFVMVLFILLAFYEMQIVLNPTAFLFKVSAWVAVAKMLSFIPQHVQLSELPFFFSVALNLSLTKLVCKPLKSFSWQIIMIIIKPQKMSYFLCLNKIQLKFNKSSEFSFIQFCIS